MATAVQELNLDDLKIDDIVPVVALDLMSQVVIRNGDTFDFSAMPLDHKLVFLLGFKKIKQQFLTVDHIQIKSGALKLDVYHNTKSLGEFQLSLKRICACLAAQNVINYVVGKMAIGKIPKCAFAANIASDEGDIQDIISIGLTPGVGMTVELLNCYDWTNIGENVFTAGVAGDQKLLRAIMILTAGAMVADDRAEKGKVAVEPNSLTKSILARAESSKLGKIVLFGGDSARTVSGLFSKIRMSTTKRDKLMTNWDRLVKGPSSGISKAVVAPKPIN